MKSLRCGWQSRFFPMSKWPWMSLQLTAVHYCNEACWHSTGRSKGPTCSVRQQAATRTSYHAKTMTRIIQTPCTPQSKGKDRSAYEPQDQIQTNRWLLFILELLVWQQQHHKSTHAVFVTIQGRHSVLHTLKSFTLIHVKLRLDLVGLISL